MNVQMLIDELKKVEDKSKTIIIAGNHDVDEAVEEGIDIVTIISPSMGIIPLPHKPKNNEH